VKPSEILMKIRVRFWTES